MALCGSQSRRYYWWTGQPVAKPRQGIQLSWTTFVYQKNLILFLKSLYKDIAN